jgi:hypothetical protein
MKVSDRPNKQWITLLATLACLQNVAIGRCDEGESWFDLQQRVSLNRCGANCLQFCAGYLGYRIKRSTIDLLLPPTGDEIDLLSIKDIADGLGLRTLAVRWNRVPPDLSSPAIVQVKSKDANHFVMLLERIQSKLLVVDVPHDPVWVDVDEFERSAGWNGYALHLSTAKWNFIPIWYQLYQPYVLSVTAALTAGIAYRVLQRARGRIATPAARSATAP